MGLAHLLTLALVCVGELAAGANVQKRGLRVPSSYDGDRKAVRDIFETSYAAYRKYAFGHDDLTPVTKVSYLLVLGETPGTHLRCVRITLIRAMDGVHLLLMLCPHWCVNVSFLNLRSMTEAR